ncbi:hypothetical protein SS05631_c14130 [Sinorhizobium sp. CCBAU 05631]|nr:hypothetical protein SS05631_c14130 [Sinorhizobium sp. CCBAU 05631]
MLENADDVARVERAAGNRMAKVRGWFGWKVASMEIVEDADNLVRITVHAEPVGAGYREKAQFEFLTDMAGQRRSSRLDAFLRASGIRERCHDTRKVEGRYFATRNGGRTAVDFGPLTKALV